MNAELIEANEGNFSGEAQLPAEMIAGGDPRPETWIAQQFDSGSQVRTGIWECTPGIMKIDNYPSDEVFTVLTGSIRVTNEDDSTFVVEPGQSCVLRKGWKGLFEAVEQTRKIFVTTR